MLFILGNLAFGAGGIFRPIAGGIGGNDVTNESGGRFGPGWLYVMAVG